MNRNLGQYMTPENLCSFLAESAYGRFDEIIDLAVGDGTLLKAFSKKHPGAQVYGVDIDTTILKTAKNKLPHAQLIHGDGLKTSVLKLKKKNPNRLIVGNPPYGISENLTEATVSSILNAFPGLKTQKGRKRLEIQFLARALNLINSSGGQLIIILPVSFADGDFYREYREILSRKYYLKKSIEFRSDVFEATEAKTIALVITDKKDVINEKTIISEFNERNLKESIIRSKNLVKGERIDAKYYKNGLWTSYKKLEDLGVSISRGRYSNKQASLLQLNAIHTTDLSKSENGQIIIPKTKANLNYIKSVKSDAIAEPGDILISRTGNRVSWDPVIVTKGRAPITDHVFRIRLPETSQEMVINSFKNPKFKRWLNSVCKGVCATVLTKNDLLKMPIFSPIY